MTRFFRNTVIVTPFQVVQDLLDPIKSMMRQVDKAAQFGRPANVQALDVLSLCVDAIQATMNQPKVPLCTDNTSVSANEEKVPKAFSSGPLF